MSTVVHERRAALRACWHPVAYAADVAVAPSTTTLDAVAVAYRRAMRGHGLG